MKNVQISDELYDEVARMANAVHVPVDIAVNALVSQRVADWARLEARAAHGSLEKFHQVLDKVPAVEPDAFDLL